MSDQPTTDALRRTCLHEEHLRLAARMVPFAGWEMPVQYSGILEEHQAVRLRAGMFDVSHMGRLEVRGPLASRLLRYICTWDISRLAPGEGHYAAVCREDGGILDDVYAFCLTPERYLLVANAANAEKVQGWLQAQAGDFHAELVDRQLSSAMIAVQGPQSLARLGDVIGHEFVGSLRPRRCGETSWQGQPLFASRTGYTGEDGLELVLEATAGPKLWRALLAADVQACGLGARDTLRLEAALLLYGNDMDERVNPWEIGLGWAVTLDDDAEFIGRRALVQLREASPKRLSVCLLATERGVMRPGCPILLSGREVGKVTSGGHSPTLAASIGLGFVPPELAVAGTELSVDVRGRSLPIRVVPRPFHRAPKQR